MLQNVKTNIKYVITPLLFSIYPVIFLYTHNIEILNLSQIVIPLLFAILLALIIFILFMLIFKQNIIASLAATGFVILFWNYDLVTMVITYYANLKHWHILPLTLFVYGHLVYTIVYFHKKYGLEKANSIFLVAVSALIIFNLNIMVPAEFKKYQAVLQDIVHNQNQMNKKEFFSEDYPDIYLIILDEYASIDTAHFPSFDYIGQSCRQFT